MRELEGGRGDFLEKVPSSPPRTLPISLKDFGLVGRLRGGRTAGCVELAG